MSDIQKGAYRAGTELTVTELGLKRRGEADALRYVLQKIAEMPYGGPRGGLAWQQMQQMQLMARGALAIDTDVNAQYALEPSAWIVERQSDPTFPRLFLTKAAADALMNYVNVAPLATIKPLYASAVTSTERGREIHEDGSLCSDCPPLGDEYDGTRCLPCPRRRLAPALADYK